MDSERNRFEEWYVKNAFNYVRDPIGSRDCSLQWAAWQAATAAERSENGQLRQLLTHAGLIAAQEQHTALRAELAECIVALEKIANPIGAMKRALPVGATLNGAMATTLSNDPNYLKEIAKAALAARKGEGNHDF